MTPTEANHHALARLANLIRRRFHSDSGRDFVVLAVDAGRPRSNTDQLPTQRIPSMRGTR